MDRNEMLAHLWELVSLFLFLTARKIEAISTLCCYSTPLDQESKMIRLHFFWLLFCCYFDLICEEMMSFFQSPTVGGFALPVKFKMNQN